MSELKPTVIFRTGPLTPEDYKEAIDALVLARHQRIEMDAGHGARFCAVCEDSGHTAEQCHHNPLIAARKWAAATRVYACYHCGFVATNDEEAREHFGSNEEEVARCIALPRQDGLGGAREDVYLVQRGGHYVGNSLVWWRPNRCGYTSDVDKAGRYSKEEASDIERQSMGEERAWKESDVIELATRHVDEQNVPARAALADGEGES